MNPDILWNLLFLAVGALVTFLAARNYYEKASEDLRKESEELQRLNDLILRALEHGGIAKLNRDSDGRVIGLELSIEGKTVALSFYSDPPKPLVQPNPK